MSDDSLARSVRAPVFWIGFLAGTALGSTACAMAVVGTWVYLVYLT